MGRRWSERRRSLPASYEVLFHEWTATEGEAFLVLTDEAGLPTNLLLKPEAPTSRRGSGSVVTSVSIDRFGALKRGHP